MLVNIFKVTLGFVIFMTNKNKNKKDSPSIGGNSNDSV